MLRAVVFINAGALLIYSIVARLIVNQEQILKLQQQNHQLELQTVQYEKLQERIEDARIKSNCHRPYNTRSGKRLPGSARDNATHEKTVSSKSQE